MLCAMILLLLGITIVFIITITIISPLARQNFCFKTAATAALLVYHDSTSESGIT